MSTETNTAAVADYSNVVAPGVDAVSIVPEFLPEFEPVGVAGLQQQQNHQVSWRVDVTKLQVPVVPGRPSALNLMKSIQHQVQELRQRFGRNEDADVMPTIVLSLDEELAQRNVANPLIVPGNLVDMLLEADLDEAQLQMMPMFSIWQVKVYDEQHQHVFMANVIALNAQNHGYSAFNQDHQEPWVEFPDSDDDSNADVQDYDDLCDLEEHSDPVDANSNLLADNDSDEFLNEEYFDCMDGDDFIDEIEEDFGQQITWTSYFWSLLIGLLQILLKLSINLLIFILKLSMIFVLFYAFDSMLQSMVNNQFNDPEIIQTHCYRQLQKDVHRFQQSITNLKPDCIFGKMYHQITNTKSQLQILQEVVKQFENYEQVRRQKILLESDECGLIYNIGLMIAAWKLLRNIFTRTFTKSRVNLSWYVYFMICNIVFYNWHSLGLLRAPTEPTECPKFYVVDDFDVILE